MIWSNFKIDRIMKEKAGVKEKFGKRRVKKKNKKRKKKRKVREGRGRDYNLKINYYQN